MQGTAVIFFIFSDSVFGPRLTKIGRIYLLSLKGDAGWVMIRIKIEKGSGRFEEKNVCECLSVY